MYYECYPDIFFLENLILDLPLLWMTGRFLHVKRRPARLLAASMLGALSACLLYFGPLHPAGRFAFPVLTVPLMMLAAFGWKSGMGFVRSVLTFTGMTLLYGGILTAVQSRFCSVLLPGAFAALLLLLLLLEGSRRLRPGVQNEYEVILGYRGHTLKLKGLRDTGNHLREPYLGRPVSILSPDAAGKILDQQTKYFQVPYHSVGNPSGMMRGVTLDYMCIRQEKDLRYLERPVVAVSPEPVSGLGAYEVILNPEYFI